MWPCYEQFYFQVFFTSLNHSLICLATMNELPKLLILSFRIRLHMQKLKEAKLKTLLLFLVIAYGAFAIIDHN